MRGGDGAGFYALVRDGHGIVRGHIVFADFKGFGAKGPDHADAGQILVHDLAQAPHAFLQGHFIGTLLEGPVAPTGEQVTWGALQGVEPAIEILARAGRYLGIAAAGLVNCLDPELIVVGGGAGAAGDLVLEPARASLADHVLGPTHRDPVPVVAAGLGPEAGAIGAAFLAAEEGRG